MRTIADAERDYDDALERGAQAVSLMQEKLDRKRRDALMQLAAVVLASGGTIRVPQHALIDARYAVVTITEDIVNNDIVLTAKVPLPQPPEKG